MASLRNAVNACIVFLTCGIASAAGPHPDPGEVAVLLDETVLIGISAQADGMFKAEILKSAPEDHPHVVLRFSGDGDMRMLEVQNHYGRTLKYTARMCMKARGLCANTSVFPVAAGLSAFESWGDPIDVLVLSKFSLE